jgi:hypothetical protein
VGTSSARSNFFGTTLSAVTQAEGIGGAAGRGALSVINNDVSNNPPYLLLGRSGAATLGSNTIVVNGSRLGTLTFHGADGTSFIEAATVAAEVDGTPGSNDMPGRLVFSTTADGAASPTERLRITSAGLLGLGTSSPSYLLDVNGASRIFNTSFKGGGASAVLNFAVGGSSGELASPVAAVSGIDRYSARSQFDGDLAFSTLVANSLTERMRITYGGNVGIGTSSWSLNSVSTKLGVNLSGTTGDGIALFSAQNSANAYVAVGSQFASSNANNGSQIRFGIDSIGDTYSMIALATANGSTPVERVRIDRLGNVGIGTTSPSTVLDVNTSSGGSQLRISNGTYVGYLGIDPAFAGIDYASQSGGHRFRIGGSFTEAVRIDSSGRLLVGTSSARSNYFNSNLYTPQLQIEGTSAAGQTMVSITSSDTSLPAYLILARQKSGTIGGNTAVANNDILGYLAFQGSDGTEFVPGAYIQAEVDGTPGANDMPGRLVFSTTADGAASPTERMRITSAGEMLLGPNQISTGTTLSAKTIGMWNGGSNTEIGWFGGAPTAVLKFNAWWDVSLDRLNITDADYTNGVILSQNSNAWGAYSDGRLKKDICPIEDSITLLKEIKPCRFVWKLSSQPDIGFIAQELKPVLPEAVDGEESDFRQEGDRFYGQMAVKHDKLVPLLTAALQEAIAKIEALETRLSALEAA